MKRPRTRDFGDGCHLTVEQNFQRWEAMLERGAQAKAARLAPARDLVKRLADSVDDPEMKSALLELLVDSEGWTHQAWQVRQLGRELDRVIEDAPRKGVRGRRPETGEAVAEFVRLRNVLHDADRGKPGGLDVPAARPGDLLAKVAAQYGMTRDALWQATDRARKAGTVPHVPLPRRPGRP